MPDPQRQPLFLARQSYRRRRLMDAARLLPVLAAFLFLMPALWGGGDGGKGRPTAGDGIYLILAWALLIALSFVIARALGRAEAAGSGTGTGTGSGAGTDGTGAAGTLPPGDRAE